jgi:hypothetical protein
MHAYVDLHGYSCQVLSVYGQEIFLIVHTHYPLPAVSVVHDCIRNYYFLVNYLLSIQFYLPTIVNFHCCDLNMDITCLRMIINNRPTHHVRLSLFHRHRNVRWGQDQV